MRSARIACITHGVLAILIVTAWGGFAPCARAEDTAATAVYLTAADPQQLENGTPGKLLVREILRQAVLIAARDELGLSTRDMTLRETIPADGGDAVLDVVTAEMPDRFIRLRITRGRGDNPAVIFEKEIPLRFASWSTFNYQGLLAVAEELSRGEIAEALRAAGWKGTPRQRVASVTPATETRERMAELNFFSQVAALRDLHTLQRNQGESPQTLAAIVRSYANLGQLIKFHWNASYKACYARSLLYAQRMVVAEKTPWSLSHRAYAETLAGLHRLALADLDEAAELAKTAGEKPASGAPAGEVEWAPLLAALCKYDAEPLKPVPADSPLAPLAALLSYLVVENSDCESLALTAGGRALEVIPECYMICDSMGRFHGVSNRHRTTTQGPMTLAATLRERLHEMPELPASVDELLRGQALGDPDANSDPAWGGGAARANLVKSLVVAGVPSKDSAEPSWEALGRLLEDVTLVQVFRRLEFFHDGLSLPSPSYHDQLATAYAAAADHPYLPLAKTATLTPSRDAEQIAKLMESAKATDIGISLIPVYRRADYSRTGPGMLRNVWWEQMNRHTDHTAEDLEQMAYYGRQPRLARELQTVSPNSPQAVALTISLDRKFSQPRLKEWEEKHPSQAVVMKALGLRYLDLGQLADAERCMKRYTEISPDQWGFATLANVYRKQNQLDKWQQALEESLGHEDFALSHARTRVTLARHFLEEKEFDRALPYAQAAAQTGAAWAMICAADCEEALEHWIQAEQWMRVTSQRYTGSALEWYLWCCRTGHGDVEAAKKLASQAAPRLSLSTNSNDWDLLGVYHLLSGNQELARKAFSQAFQRGGNPWSALHEALIADEAGDVAARDKALVAAVDRGSQATGQNAPPPSLIELARWMNNAYHEPADAAPHVQALDELITSTTGADYQANLCYFAARFFQNRGQPELARKYLDRCVTKRVTKWNYTLAQKWLRSLPAAEPAAEAAAGSESSQ